VIGAQNERGPGISVRHGELSAAETVDALPHREWRPRNPRRKFGFRPHRRLRRCVRAITLVQNSLPDHAGGSEERDLAHGLLLRASGHAQALLVRVTTLGDLAQRRELSFAPRVPHSAFVGTRSEDLFPARWPRNARKWRLADCDSGTRQRVRGQSSHCALQLTHPATTAGSPRIPAIALIAGNVGRHVAFLGRCMPRLPSKPPCKRP
jgi:hypothetical protein